MTKKEIEKIAKALRCEIPEHIEEVCLPHVLAFSVSKAGGLTFHGTMDRRCACGSQKFTVEGIPDSACTVEDTEYGFIFVGDNVPHDPYPMSDSLDREIQALLGLDSDWSLVWLFDRYEAHDGLGTYGRFFLKDGKITLAD